MVRARARLHLMRRINDPQLQLFGAHAHTLAQRATTQLPYYVLKHRRSITAMPVHKRPK